MLRVRSARASLFAARRVAGAASDGCVGRRWLSSGGGAAAQEYARLEKELETIKDRMLSLEASHPEVRSAHAARDGFTPPRLHHINIVSREVDSLLTFYRDVMRMDEMPISMFPRTPASGERGGTDVPIRFTTDGAMQMQ